MPNVKLDKLDMAVFVLVALCLAGLALAGFISDPSRRPDRIAYLHPALGATPNVWLADIDNPQQRQQLTHSEQGIFDFDISPDGRWLAYAERMPGGSVTLRLLDMRGGQRRELVDCAALNALCSAPAFSPSGDMLAYQRAETLGGSYGLSRIWLVDMNGASYETIPLIGDSQVVGHSPLWSGDSNTLAFYSADSTQPGILIYDLQPRGDEEAQLRFIPSAHGSMGSLAPNGQQVIFPDLVFRESQFYSHLQIADLAAREFAAFTDPNGPTDDVAARYSPDGRLIAIARRYTDSRWTPGHQIYVRELEAGDRAWQAVAYDADYSTSYMRWDRAGKRLVTQRFPLHAQATDNGPARPEIWIHELASGLSRMIVRDAYLPQWAPS